MTETIDFVFFYIKDFYGNFLALFLCLALSWGILIFFTDEEYKEEKNKENKEKKKIDLYKKAYKNEKEKEKIIY
jgi:hypothetical protein